MREPRQTLTQLREQKYGAGKPRHVETHEKVAAAADTTAKATRVVAGAAVAGAFVAAPTGLTAVGVSLGLSMPH